MQQWMEDNVRFETFAEDKLQLVLPRFAQFTSQLSKGDGKVFCGNLPSSFRSRSCTRFRFLIG